LERPQQFSTCRHIFCGSCIAEWLLISSICPIDLNQVQMGFLVAADRIYVELLNRLLLICEFHNQGCPAILKYERLEAHTRACPFNPRNVEAHYSGAAPMEGPSIHFPSSSSSSSSSSTRERNTLYSFRERPVRMARTLASDYRSHSSGRSAMQYGDSSSFYALRSQFRYVSRPRPYVLRQPARPLMQPLDLPPPYSQLQPLDVPPPYSEFQSGAAPMERPSIQLPSSSSSSSSSSTPWRSTYCSASETLEQVSEPGLAIDLSHTSAGGAGSSHSPPIVDSTPVENQMQTLSADHVPLDMGSSPN